MNPALRALITTTLACSGLSGCLINQSVYDSAIERAQAATPDCTADDANLIEDGSFEAFGSGAFSAWESSSATLTATEEGSHCDFALRVDTLTGGGATHPVGGTLRPGDTLYFEADVRHEAGENVSPGWIVYMHDTDGDANQTGAVLDYTGSTDWHTIRAEMVLPDRPVDSFTTVTMTVFGNTEGATTFALDHVVVTAQQ